MQWTFPKKNWKIWVHIYVRVHALITFILRILVTLLTEIVFRVILLLFRKYIRIVWRVFLCDRQRIEVDETHWIAKCRTREKKNNKQFEWGKKFATCKRHTVGNNKGRQKKIQRTKCEKWKIRKINPSTKTILSFSVSHLHTDTDTDTADVIVLPSECVYISIHSFIHS